MFRTESTAGMRPSGTQNSSYHPDHEVGEEGYPECGGQEGEQVPARPSRLVAVGDGAVKQKAYRPGEQPLQLCTPPI